MSIARRFHARFVGNASPSALAVVRIVTCATLFASAVWENPASLARIPIELRHKMGLLEVLYKLPIGFEHFVQSAGALRLFQALTAAVLFLAGAGVFTRVTLPVAAFCYAVLGGLMRQYAWFYHTGLIPLYLMVGLSFLPAGDGLSFDAWRRRRRGTAPDPYRPTARYGWARYLCWILLAIPYLLAGFSKLREGFDPPWWDGLNFARTLLGTNVRVMHFEFDGALWLVHAHVPWWFFELLGISAVVSEVGFILVLFSRWARLILPPTMLLLHIGILFLQNILFFDLIILQLIFVDWDWVFKRLGKGVSRDEGYALAAPVPNEQAALGKLHTRYGTVCGVLSCYLLVWWVTDAEYYPFTSMQMFTGEVNTSGVVVYQQLFARDASGRRQEFRVEELIPGMGDTRYRQFIRVFKKSNKARERAHVFLEFVGKRWNRRAREEDRIVEFEIELRAWDFRNFPDDREYGVVRDSFRHKMGKR